MLLLKASGKLLRAQGRISPEAVDSLFLVNLHFFLILVCEITTKVVQQNKSDGDGMQEWLRLIRFMILSELLEN